MMGSSEAGHIRLRTTGFGQLGSAGSDNEQHSPNSNSFMSAAVAARAAQLNGGGGGYFHPATATAPQGTLQRWGLVAGQWEKLAQEGKEGKMKNLTGIQ
jgi:hypothetical protein